MFEHGLTVPSRGCLGGRAPRRLPVHPLQGDGGREADGLAARRHRVASGAGKVEAQAPSARCRSIGPPRVRTLPGGSACSRVSFKMRARSRGCGQPQRPSSAHRKGGLAASGCQSRKPRGERVCRAGTPGETSTTSPERVFRSFP